jgi:hypothetical protein
MRKTALTALLALACAGATAGPAAAAHGVRYVGQTRSGEKITFTRVGHRVKNVKSGVPVTCLSINRVADSQTGVDPWVMPDAFRIGRTSSVSRLMYTALYYSPVTVTAKTTLKLARHGRITGKLDEVFAYAVPTYPIPETIDYACHGATTFTAHRR